MDINGWAFTENEKAISCNRYSRYKELKALNQPLIKIDSRESGYAHKIYRGEVLMEGLSELDVLLLCDNGNTCFGGTCTINSNKKFVAKIYTD
jgi:hypothetical protein